MAYNEHLLNKVREALIDLPKIEEKKMFGGVCFMIDDKLCICVNEHEMLCRIDPSEFEEALEMDGVRPMMQRKRTAKGYVFVHEDIINSEKKFDYWVSRALSYNKKAKAYKKK